MEYEINSIKTRTNEFFLPLLVNNTKLILDELEHEDSVLEEITYILKKRFERAYSSADYLSIDYSATDELLIIEINDKGMPCHMEDLSLDITCRQELASRRGQTLRIELPHKTTVDINKLIKPLEEGEELLDTNILIRPVKPNNYEIIEVIKCLYSAYGYGYIYGALYHLEYFMQLLQSGKYISLVAVNEHQQVLGHAALNESFEKLPEVSNAVTKPFCRGLNIAQNICERLLEIAEENGANGAMMQPVAFHPFVQKMALKQGYVVTAFLFHYLNKEATGIYQDGDRRLDTVLAVKLFERSKSTPRKIVAPDEHKSFIGSIYDKLGASYEFIEEEAPTMCGKYSQTFLDEMSVSKVVVDVCPKDIKEVVWRSMIECVRNKAEMVEIYINIFDPAALYAYREFKKLLGVFTGILPGAQGGDYIIVQHRMGLSIDFDKVVVIDENQEFLDYIRHHTEEL